MPREQFSFRNAAGTVTTEDVNPENNIWALSAAVTALDSTGIEDPERDGLRATGYGPDLPKGKHHNFIWQLLYSFAKEVGTKGVAEWSTLVDYAVPALVHGSDGILYASTFASGPSSTVKDPITPANRPGFWDTLSNTLGGGSPLTTKGDIYAYDTTGSRFPVSGAVNGDVITRDAAQAFGFKWSPPPGKIFQVSYDIATEVAFNPAGWRTYPLNTTLKNQITGSLGSSQITVPAGDYEISASAFPFPIAFSTPNRGFQLRVRNITDGTTAAKNGQVDVAGGTIDVSYCSVVSGNVSIAAPKVFELQIWADAGSAASWKFSRQIPGFGSGETARAATVTFKKI